MTRRIETVDSPLLSDSPAPLLVHGLGLVESALPVEPTPADVDFADTLDAGLVESLNAWAWRVLGATS